jgi:crossover junction endodeoxyribonuclease RuvC
MRVLGIDPGYDRLGVAVMERQNGKDVLLHSDCIVTDKALPFETRLNSVGAAVEGLIAAWAPHALALERLFFSSNQRTAMRVAEVRGAMLYLAERHACRVCEYTPQEVKVAITGYGKSDKDQVTRMVMRLVPNARKGALDDEYDAIAVAATCLASVRP